MGLPECHRSDTKPGMYDQVSDVEENIIVDGSEDALRASAD